MGMTFKEKSLWVQQVAILVVFGSYLSSLDFSIPESFPASSTVYLIGLILLLVVLNILGHILVAAFNQPENEDERDKLIELKATRISAFIQGAGIVMSIFVSISLQNFFITINLLIQTLVIAEVAGKAVQLFYYRKGS